MWFLQVRADYGLNLSAGTFSLLLTDPGEEITGRGLICAVTQHHIHVAPGGVGGDVSRKIIQR